MPSWVFAVFAVQCEIGGIFTVYGLIDFDWDCLNHRVKMCILFDIIKKSENFQGIGVEFLDLFAV